MPLVSGMPIGAATGPESGVRMPSVMVLFVRSTPGPPVKPVLVLVLPQPATNTVTNIHSSAQKDIARVRFVPRNKVPIHSPLVG